MGWGSIDTHLGLEALGNRSKSTDAFQVLQGVPQLEVVQQWGDELDATMWAWSHLYPRSNQTDEIIVINVRLPI